MLRDLDTLTARTFDLLVVGGGIHGLMAAWDAALRGLDVALIERHDFGAGASFHHHRTLHGGLRYLQSAHLRRLRQSVCERRTWARIAPQFIAPQAFAVPAGDPRGRPAVVLRAAFLADAVLAADRNRGVPPALRLPRARVVEAGTSGIDTGGLLGDGPLGVWYDYRTEHPERLTLAVALAASRAGAVLANSVDAIEPLREGRRITGIAGRDQIGGGTVRISARITLNAAGAGAGRLMAGFGLSTRPLLVKAMNLVTRRDAPRVACGAPTRGGRLLFALPWRERLSIGTWHGNEPCGADADRVTPGELDAFIAEVNDAFPSIGLTRADVTLVQRGIVPAIVKHGRVELADRPLLREHRQDGVDGAISLAGVKYTTARALAEQAVTMATAQLGRHAPSRTATEPLLPAVAGAPSPAPQIDACAWEYLQRVYGADAVRVAAAAQEAPALAARIVPSQPIIGAQVVEAARHEMAHTLEDVVLRRTGLGSAGYPGDQAILQVERILRDELAWTSSRASDEVELLKEFYLPLAV